MKQTTWEFRNIDKFPLLCLSLATFSSKKIKNFLFIRKCSHLLLFTRITIYYKDCFCFSFSRIVEIINIKNNISRKQENYFQEFLQYYIFKEVYIIQEV